MNISEETFEILKNFSTIDKSIKIAANSNNLVTVSPSVIGKATVQEEFPVEVRIYELGRFLALLSLFDQPDLDFTQSWATISSGKSNVKYLYSDPTIPIAEAPIELQPIENPFVTLSISKEELKKVITTAGVMQVPNIMIVGENGNLLVRAADASRDNSNKYDYLAGETDQTFTVSFNKETFSVILDDYDIRLNKKGNMYMKAKTHNVEYWIAAIKSLTKIG